MGAGGGGHTQLPSCLPLTDTLSSSSTALVSPVSIFIVPASSLWQPVPTSKSWKPMSPWQDIRFGLKMLVKDRWFTLAAATALALGIGVNAMVFTLVNAVLVRNLPFRD